MMRPLMIALACLPLLACEAKTEEAAPSASAKASAKAPAPSPSASAAPSANASAAPTANVPADALTVPQLAGDFASRIDKTVKLAAKYLNANSVEIKGKMTVQNIILVEDKGKMKPNVTCVLADDSKPKVEGMKQYTELVVEGKVKKGGFGDAELVDCKILSP